MFNEKYPPGKEWGIEWIFDEGTPQQRAIYMDYHYTPGAPPKIEIISAGDFHTGPVELTEAQAKEVIAWISENPPEPDDAGDDGF